MKVCDQYVSYFCLKALLAKTSSLEKINFTWYNTTSENYEKQVKEKGEAKRFDFIHMIQVFGIYLIHDVEHLEDFTVTSCSWT